MCDQAIMQSMAAKKKYEETKTHWLPQHRPSTHPRAQKIERDIEGERFCGTVVSGSFFFLVFLGGWAATSTGQIA
jgi:hypothetical protein